MASFFFIYKPVYSAGCPPKPEAVRRDTGRRSPPCSVGSGVIGCGRARADRLTERLGRRTHSRDRATSISGLYIYIGGPQRGLASLGARSGRRPPPTAVTWGHARRTTTASALPSCFSSYEPSYSVAPCAQGKCLLLCSRTALS